MKVWFGYGSEHSMNLILIGRFESVAMAESAVERIEALRGLAETEISEPSWGPSEERITDQFRQAMWDMEIYDMARAEVEGFIYEYQIDRYGTELQIRTDETEIQGFLKVLLKFGAKVEVFSLHQWNKDGTSRSNELSGD